MVGGGWYNLVLVLGKIEDGELALARFGIGIMCDWYSMLVLDTCGCRACMPRTRPRSPKVLIPHLRDFIQTRRTGCFVS